MVQTPLANKISVRRLWVRILVLLAILGGFVALNTHLDPTGTRLVVATPSVATPVTGVTTSPAVEVSPEPLSTGEPVAPLPTESVLPVEEVPQPLYDFSQMVPVSSPVDHSWFSDAALVGDSRVDGLFLYSSIVPGVSITANGMKIYDASNPEWRGVRGADGKNYTVLELLSQGEYNKIYVSLGLNEMGYNSDQAFMDAYSLFIDQLREAQPTAVIYIQELIPINESLVDPERQWFLTNQRVTHFNEMLRQVAQEKQVFLIPIPSALLGTEGELREDSTADGVHFRRDFYEIWYTHWLVHTVDAELFWRSYQPPVDPLPEGLITVHPMTGEMATASQPPIDS